jgi:hypothetical protein
MSIAAFRTERLVDPRLANVVVFILLSLLAVGGLAAVALGAYALFFLDLDSVALPSDSALSAVVQVLRQQSRATICIAGVVGLVVVVLVELVAIRIVSADRIDAWGLKFEITDALKDAQADLRSATREIREKKDVIVSLAENVRELQKVQEHLSQFLIEPTSTSERLADLLDSVVQCAAFMIRPAQRAVRVSVWLYRSEAKEMRIVAAYRVSQRTRRHLVFRDDDAETGFAMEVLRSRRPIEKHEGFLSNDGWRRDPWSNHTTTSALGQPVQIGTDDEWQAVLCFSTDRNLNDYPSYAFSVQGDAAELSLLSHITSTVLTLGLLFVEEDDIFGQLEPAAGGIVVSTDTTPWIEVLWNRYASPDV